VVSVLPAAARIEQERPRPLRLAVDTTSSHLPLVVAGAKVAFGDVDRALEQSIERALAASIEDLARRRTRALGLSVELVEARAEYAHDRLIVHLAVRATLRENAGNLYLAQTHAHASSSAVVSAEHGAKVVLDCTDSIGRQLSGWLSGMDLG